MVAIPSISVINFDENNAGFWERIRRVIHGAAGVAHVTHTSAAQ